MSWIAEYDTQGREFPTCVHVTKTTGGMIHGATYVPIEDGKAVRAENAKLRELVGDLREYIAGNADACDFCPQLGTCENHPAPPQCKYELTDNKDSAVLDYIADCLSELGVPE